ncbi:GntR family transcriptional regulator [Pseudomonas sp. M30-35]|uniref:GntR family transcriptional regulator n=1 Tax=Pseudomonas sp. M30-35 TaxID=1981174 RepID=UPI000B3BED16|nr:GntR family transcriptional regulator [Pseudomonas sp. M30-35]ARU87776.1 GntR family transcriptional regulator [Pseudomonas sp. M30-35]
MNALTLGSDQRLPLYQRLRDEMLAKISSGEWRPGEPIPTEAELTKVYSVAIGTVRKAVDTLVIDGLLQRSQGRGTFVRRPDFNSSFFRFFRQVNSSGEHQVPQSRIVSLCLEQAPEAVVEALKLDTADAVIRMQRIRMADGRAVFSEDIWLPASRFAKLLEVDPHNFGNLLYPFYEEQCGQLVASAKETLTVEPGDALTSAALGVDAGMPIVVIERIALSYDNTPLEYRISRGAADTFRYQIEIS